MIEAPVLLHQDHNVLNVFDRARAPRRRDRGRVGQRRVHRRLLNQMGLQIEELEADAAEGGLAAEVAAEKTASVAAFERK